MRVMTDEKRDAILAAAWQVFGEKGFEGTAISDVSDRIRGSKATIYRYFKSKEELFAAALEQALMEWIDGAFERLSSTGNLRQRLLEFGRRYLETRLSTEMITIDRALITAAERSSLGIELWAQLIEPRWRRFAEVLDQEMTSGHLRPADPYMAAMHFRGLIEADMLERRLHGDAAFTADQIENALVSGIEVFLRAYAP